MLQNKVLIGFLLVAVLGHINCECSFNGAYSEVAKYAINFEPLYPTCSEFHFGGFNIKKTISLAFANSVIDCNLANIIITNEFRQPIFNFCQDRLTSLKYDSYFVILNLVVYAPFGSIVTDMSFSLGNSTGSSTSAPSTTVTLAPPSTTTAKPSTVAPSTTAASSLKCGTPTYKPNDSEMRIIGGVEAVPHSWPWQVFLTDGATMCGGSLINEQWILTAAHCITGNPTKAFIGVHDISAIYASSGVPVSKIIAHPLYNTDTLKNDIALMKLERPVTFTDKIQPICLPTKLNPIPGRVAMVTGWGKVGDNDGTSNKLQQVAVPIRSNTECSFFNIGSTQFCAGTSAGTVRDSCQGDSGGPLVTKEGTHYELAGVVSYGGPSCDGYGVYTSVYSYLDWIAKTTTAY